MKLTLEPDTVLGPVNACIYCGVTEPDAKLTDEHIIPLSIGGTHILPKASCRACATQTAKLEGYAGRKIFQDVRIEYELPTRRPKERPTQLPLRESFSPSPEAAPIRYIAAKEYPGALILMIPEPAGILLGRSPGQGVKFQPFVRQLGGRERVELLKQRGIEAKLYRELKPDLFLRLVAKIALGYAVASYGLDAFEPTVRDVILRRDTDPFHWVGGVTKEMNEFPTPSGKPLAHRIVAYKRDVAGTPHFVVQLQLLAFLAAPSYAVVVGKARS
jgi:HNH endonuclease